MHTLKRLIFAAVLAGLLAAVAISPALASHQWCDGGGCAPIHAAP